MAGTAYKKAAPAPLLEKKGVLYPDAKSYGIKIAAHGWNVIYSKSKAIHFTKAWVREEEFGMLRHPKEQKQQSINRYVKSDLRSRSYVLGKINSLYTLRLRYGYIYKLAEKASRSGVEVSAKITGGAVLGILKPYHLDLFYPSTTPDDQNFLIVTNQKYTTQNLRDFINPTHIYGYSGFYNGFLGIRPLPGATACASLTFDWSGYEDKIKQIETGVMLDAFAFKAPLMLQTNNHKFFPSVFLSVQMGKRH